MDEGRIGIVGEGVKAEEVQVNEAGGIHQDAPSDKY